jgi:hypothetical protein
VIAGIYGISFLGTGGGSCLAGKRMSDGLLVFCIISKVASGAVIALISRIFAVCNYILRQNKIMPKRICNVRNVGKSAYAGVFCVALMLTVGETLFSV